MSSKVTFSKTYPLPDYTGPKPVWRAHFPWAGASDCYVRRNGKVWETAPADQRLAACDFRPSVAGDRYTAVVAFDFYNNPEGDA